MLTIGQLLQERYHITAKLGQGGMGAVYRAYDNRLNKECVVKEMLITPEMSSSLVAAAEQFKREAQVLANLQHPSLPRVIDYFTDQGNNYLVMDFVQGQNLYRLIGAQGLPEAAVLSYANQLLEVLDYIHNQGVVHRDIKPANIIITSNGRVVLVDFGLVKVMDAGGGGTLTFAQHSGTPEYAPPEQLKGGTDQRSDIYSLGATLYHALTGTPPLDATDRSMKEMPSIRQLKPTVSAHTERVASQALMMQPAKRFASAAAMRAELGGALRVVAPALPPESQKTVVMPRSKGAARAAPVASVKPNSDKRQKRMLMGAAVGAAVLILLAALVMRGALGEGGNATVASALTRTPEPTATSQPGQPTVTVDSATLTSAPAPNTPQPDASSELIITLSGNVQMMLVRVPAGEFLMGSSDSDAAADGDEKPQHTVMLGEYWIGKYEVTNAQYAAYAHAKGLDWTPPAGIEKHPVVNVSWDDAVAFCAWVSEVGGRKIRLPTEAEWEKAARGTDGRIYPWGNQSPDPNWANFNYNAGTTTEVGKYSPAGISPYGAADMAGNAWEWTSSLVASYPYKANDGREDQSSRDARVIRGGGFDLAPNLIRAAIRDNFVPVARYDDLGFRIAASPK